MMKKKEVHLSTTPLARYARCELAVTKNSKPNSDLETLQVRGCFWAVFASKSNSKHAGQSVGG